VLAVGQSSERLGHRLAVFLHKDLVRRIGGSPEVEQAMGMAPAAVSLASERVHEVAGRHNGVRGKALIVYPRTSFQHTRQGLLNDILSNFGIPDPRSNYPANQLGQIENVSAISVLGGLHTALLRACLAIVIACLRLKKADLHA
jgi:hypothetical protein